MIAWLLARPRLIAYGLAGAAILGAAGLVWWRVSAWRSAYQERPALVAERDAAVATNAALVEAVHRAAEIGAEAEGRVETVTREAATVRTVYRDAVRTDPTCAEWARSPVLCPIGGVDGNHQLE